MFKRINIFGILIFVMALLIVQVGFGFFISPAFTGFIVDKANEYTNAKIMVDKVNVWPVTLSVSIKGLKVFDPENDEKRMISIPKASFGISLWGLLSKRLVFSNIDMQGADINLEGEADGSFNVQKLAQGKEADKGKGVLQLLDRFKGKKDWFSRVYDMIKKRSAKKAEDKEMAAATTEVTELAKGRRVHFKTKRDDYIFEIKQLKLSDCDIHVVVDGKSAIDIDKASFKMREVAIDPAKGAYFKEMALKGTIRKDGNVSGRFDLLYDQYRRNKDEITEMSVVARDVDLAAVGFIYENSLPVDFEKGTIDLDSRTKIVNESMDSRNSITLTGHQLVPKKGTNQLAAGFLPMPVVCEAMNGIDPVKLKFDVTGTAAKPELGGFQENLQTLLEPTLKNVQEKAKQEGMNAINRFLGKKSDDSAKEGDGSQGTTDDKVQNTINSLKSLFEKSQKATDGQ